MSRVPASEHLITFWAISAKSKPKSNQTVSRSRVRPFDYFLSDFRQKQAKKQSNGEPGPGIRAFDYFLSDFRQKQAKK